MLRETESGIVNQAPQMNAENAEYGATNLMPCSSLNPNLARITLYATAVGTCMIVWMMGSELVLLQCTHLRELR